jgi:hypothetical protein
MASAIATAVGRPSAAGRIGTLSDTPYLKVMYIGLMIAAVIVAFALLHTGRPIAWAAGRHARRTDVDRFRPQPDDRPAQRDRRRRQLEGGPRSRLDVRRDRVVLLSAYALSLARREQRPGVHVAVRGVMAASGGDI